MPRVRIPNASLIASADLPILPFLAPRVFAESPISRSRGFGRHDDVQKEKEKTATRVEELGEAQARTGVQATCLKRGTVSGQQKNFAAGLTRTASHWKGAHRPTSVNRLYADISAFARQHVRCYATTASTASTVRKVAGRTRSLRERARKVPKLRTWKRDKAYALERERLLNYISRLPPGLATTDRMWQGQYRSLSRRVSNLLHWDATHLDLSKTTGSTNNRHRLNLAFAALDRTLYASLGQHTRKMNIKHHPKCARLSWMLFPPDINVDTHQVWTSWMEIDIRTRKAFSYRLLIYLLDRKPDRALRFIQALSNDPLLQGHRTEAIADALGHISKVHAAGLYGVEQKWGVDPAAHKLQFVPAFVHVLEQALAQQQDVCSQDLLYNLSLIAEKEDLKQVFDCLVKHRMFLGFDTILHYASSFGKAGEVPYALRCLDELRARFKAGAWESVVERTRLRWTCATILRKSMSQSQDFHQTPLVVAALVRQGIKMDVLLYNIVMHNAMEAGDYATAFKVYNALESNGLKADKYTFSILLHGCTLQNNPAMFQDFAQYCAEVAKETKDAWLATDYLYYVYVRHRADTEPEHASALLWQAYTSLFWVAPLKPLIDIDNTQTLDSTLMAPPSVALYIMLQTEIRVASAMSNHRVLNLYQNFRTLAQETQNSSFRALTQDPTVWNAFLLAFCSKQQFASASELIRDMSNGPASPNIYSWNIFMQAFFKTGQVQAAERVFEIMRNRGVDPDQFTYGVLLRGYAKAQLVERVGETMLHVETAEELDPDLLRSLAGVVERQRLMLTLEQSRINKEARTREKAERKTEEERVRWTPPQFRVATRETQASELDTTVTEAPQEPAGSHNSVNEDEGLFNFLQDEPRASPKPTSTPPLPPAPSSPPPQPTPQYRIRTPRPAPPNDPEVQYQKLQEQLGIIQPSEPEPQPKPVAPFGASGLDFKSVLSKRKEEPTVCTLGANLGFKQQERKEDGEKGEEKREPVRLRRIVPRVRARRVLSAANGDGEEPRVTASRVLPRVSISRTRAIKRSRRTGLY